MALQSRVIKGQTSITQPYHINGQRGYNYDHLGIDLTGFNGSYNVLAYITAHSDGTVVDVRKNCTGFEYNSYGNYVLLKHNNGMFTMYAHLSYGQVSVSNGQKVKQGQILGYMGNTGTSYGGHLHFEIRQANGTQIDPEPYLNKDLPNNSSIIYTYKVFDNITKSYLPAVENNTDYAGIKKHSIGGTKIDSNKSSLRYSVHVTNKKAWTKEVRNASFAGLKGNTIDGFILFSNKQAAYRVHLLNTNKWLPWVKTKNSNYKDAKNGFAGIFGQPIDAIQIKPL